MQNTINKHFERVFGIWIVSTIDLILLEGPVNKYASHEANPEIVKSVVQLFETIFKTPTAMFEALIIAGISEILILFLRRG